MKTPICTFDAKSGILCPTCESKLQSGHLNGSDVELSMKLARLTDKLPELEKITLVRGHEVNGDFVLVLGGGNLNAVRKDTSFLERLSGELGRRTWTVEGDTSDRKMLEDLFFPIRILTVNVIWLPDGSKLTKVIVPGRRTSELPIDIEGIKEVVKKIRGIELLVEFERS